MNSPQNKLKNKLSCKKEAKRLLALTQLEQEARLLGFARVIGVDEVGRGPLAGPVVAAALLIEEGIFFEGINDSKQLCEKKREELFETICNHPQVTYGIGLVDVEEIDRINIYQASHQAMLRALQQITPPPDYILTDAGVSLCFPFATVRKVKQCDALSQMVAGASLLAKVTRDLIMENSDALFPEYGFKEHKGYGTRRHLQALKDHGPSPIHRRSFSPVKDILSR